MVPKSVTLTKCNRVGRKFRRPTGFNYSLPKLLTTFSDINIFVDVSAIFDRISSNLVRMQEVLEGV
jgi:hypothetical protein